MIKYKKYFISNGEGKSNCIVRSFCKMFKKDYDEVFNELVSISQLLNCDNFNDIKVFEEYLKKHNFLPIDDYKDIIIKDLSLDNSNYIVFCYDKKDWYHMVPIINNVLYDKDDKSLNAYVITVYKEQ